MAADGVMCEAIAAADLVVGFGLDPVEIDKTWHAERPIHWVLESPNACGIVPAGSHARQTTRALLDALVGERPPAAWTEPFREFQDARKRMLTDRTTSTRTHAARRHCRSAGVGDAAGHDGATPPSAFTVPVSAALAQPRAGCFWMSNGLSGWGTG